MWRVDLLALAKQSDSMLLDSYSKDLTKNVEMSRR